MSRSREEPLLRRFSELLLTGKLTDVTIAVDATGSWYQTVELLSTLFEVRRTGRDITYRRGDATLGRCHGTSVAPDPLARCIAVICPSVVSVAREAGDCSVAWMCRLRKHL